MDIKFIIAQLFGLLALFFLAISFRKNRKKYLLRYQVLSSVSYALQYLFLGEYVGFFLHTLCIIRNKLYNNYKNGEVPIIILIMVVASMIGISLLSYSGIYDLLPLVGIVLNSYGLWQKKLKTTRRLNFIACIFCIIYSAIVRAYTGVVATTFELLMVSIAIYRFDLKRKK